MVSFGRVACVALPFVLALVSIVALLVATLAGISNKDIHLFQINTTALSISAADAVNLVHARSAAPVAVRSIGYHGKTDTVGYHDPSLLNGSDDDDNDNGKAAADTTSSNITASDLGLGKLYDFNLWNFCETQQNGTRNCTTPAFDYAHKSLNATEQAVEAAIHTHLGADVSLPKSITDAISTFSTLLRWTEIVFIIAFGCLAAEIVFGLFTSCSRGMSCLTSVVASVTAAAVIAAAAMSTAMALIVVGVIKEEAKKYGVTASVHSGILAALWIAAAAALIASFFWTFTVCCCSPDKGGSRRHRHADREAGVSDKAPLTGAYQPLADPHQPGFHSATAYAPAARFPEGARSDLAYEPYSHARV